MNNIGGSDEWSTGCESGWTIYLDESAYISRNNDNPNQNYYTRIINSDVNDIDDQDLSMVSDASSGPPHCKHQFNDDEQQRYYSRSNQNSCYSEKSSKTSQKRLKKPNKKDQKKVGFNKHNDDDDDNQQYHACYSSSNLLLDDTASSPFSHSQVTYYFIYSHLVIK